MSYVNMITRTVETPLGPMYAHFNSGTCVVFNQDRNQVLVVNRVEYRAYFTARLIDGTWQIDTDENRRQSTLELNRRDSVKAYDYSRAALNKAEKVLSDWLPGWAAEQTLTLAEAEARNCEEKLNTLLGKLRDARDLVANLEIEKAQAAGTLAAAMARLDSLRTLANDSDELTCYRQSIIANGQPEWPCNGSESTHDG